MIAHSTTNSAKSSYTLARAGKRSMQSRNKVFLAAIPEDAIEELFCRDISIWVWEIRRYQRIKAATIKASMRQDHKRYADQ